MEDSMTMPHQNCGHRASSEVAQAAMAAERLRLTFVATSIGLVWLGEPSPMHLQSRGTAAGRNGAGGQRRPRRKDAALRDVLAAQSKILAYWHVVSLPYPDPRVRLIPQNYIATFDADMMQHRAAMYASLQHLDRQLEPLRAALDEWTGSPGNATDGEDALRALFAVEWEYPNLEPPEQLLRQEPCAYQRDRQRLSARYRFAVSIAEQSFMSDLGQLLGRLLAVLKPERAGSSEVVSEPVQQLNGLIGRFTRLSLRSNDVLEQMILSARQALIGATPEQLQCNGPFRREVIDQLSLVQATLISVTGAVDLR
jgi:hypothetical protein